MRGESEKYLIIVDFSKPKLTGATNLTSSAKPKNRDHVGIIMVTSKFSSIVNRRNKVQIYIAARQPRLIALPWECLTSVQEGGLIIDNFNVHANRCETGHECILHYTCQNLDDNHGRNAPTSGLNT